MKKIILCENTEDFTEKLIIKPEKSKHNSKNILNYQKNSYIIILYIYMCEVWNDRKNFVRNQSAKAVNYIW